jgi:two-component system phosphate regulon response regulator PhoB
MGQRNSILVVDGDAASRRRISQSIASAMMDCIEAETASEALESAQREAPDIVVLDLYLPDMSGLGLSRLLREMPDLENIPIIVVSEHASEIDRILAFETGVDDFLAKPFYPPELAARIQTILRTTQRTDRPATSPSDASRVQVDREALRVSIDGRPVDLTVTELAILATLIERAGKVVRRRELVELLRGPNAGQSDRAVDAHVKSIRRKLGSARASLQTVRGIGYRFDEHDSFD